jgi:porin
VGAEVGDLQGISNLEAPSEWRLYEAWIEQQIGSPQLTLLAGVYDLNSDFDVIPAAADLLNGSFGLGPEYGFSGDAGPSTYPNTGFAARIKVQPLPSLYGLFGVSDAVPGGTLRTSYDDGVLISFEAGYARVLNRGSASSRSAPRPDRRTRGQGIDRPPHLRRRRRIGRGRLIEEVSMKVALGGWAYTRQLQAWAPSGSRGRSWGLYILGEKLLHQSREGEGRLSGFARLGTAADGFNRLDGFLGGGVAYRGALPGRPDDVAALGIAHGRNGSPFLRAQRETGTPMERAETVMELTFRIQVGRFFVIQPDLQWVMNPGMNPDLADALVFGLRSHLLLEFPGSSRNH